MISRSARPIVDLAADYDSAAQITDPNAERDHSITRSLLVHWHLLSLDAPTVAVLWTVFTAAITHTRLPIVTPVAMGLTVWTLYASDRLLDTRHLGSRPASTMPDLEPRHLFHHRYRTAFLTAILICTVVLATLLPLLPLAAIKLYLREAALMVGYFLLIHAAPRSATDTRLSTLSLTSSIPKELLVGPFFAAAIFIPTISGRPELRLQLLPLAILFTALCSLNCLYIFAWEHQTTYRSHWATTYSVRNLSDLTYIFLAASLLCFAALSRIAHLTFHLYLYPIACAVSALLLVALHKLRDELSPLAMRAAADGALLTPLPILPFLFWHRG